MRLGQGRENVKRFLDEDEKLSGELETKVRQKLGLIPEPENKAEQVV